MSVIIVKKTTAEEEEDSEEVITRITTVRYLTDDKVHFCNDVYQLTMALNITDDVYCSPQEFIFCLRQCVYVWGIQCSIALFFAYDYLDFDRFRTTDWNSIDCCARVLCGLLL